MALLRASQCKRFLSPSSQKRLALLATQRRNNSTETKANVQSNEELRFGSWQVKPHLNFSSMEENADTFRSSITQRRMEHLVDMDRVVSLYREWKALTIASNNIRQERNEIAAILANKKIISKTMPNLPKDSEGFVAQLSQTQRQQLIQRGKALKEESAAKEVQLAAVHEEMVTEGKKVPNTVHIETPIGINPRLLSTVGTKLESPLVYASVEDAENGKEPLSQSSSSLKFKSHIEVAEAFDLIDFERAALCAGQKSYYLKNEAALMELALVNYAMGKLLSKGFTPILPPDLVRRQIVEGCGFQPRANHSQVYSIENSDLCLAGTAEIPLAGMLANEFIDEKKLPMRVAGFGHCFRTEVGSGGTQVKGLYRVHQFSKVEMFVWATPEQSEALLWELTDIQVELFSELGLHFKVLDMPSEDLGAPAHRKIDLEAWMPGRESYGEISSASNCLDYQSRRLFSRYRSTDQSLQFLHTLNGTAMAVPRVILTLLENNQFYLPDGSLGGVLIPKALQPFMFGKRVITFKN